MKKAIVVLTLSAALGGWTWAADSDQASIDWVLVHGGSFSMGAKIESEDMGRSLLPVHEVEVSNFYLSRYEVTVAEYRRFAVATKRQMPPAPTWGWVEDHPIVNVSWYDALAFCHWVGGRLPTEAEWEFAVKGGRLSKGFKYSGGDDSAAVGWVEENSGGSTRPAGKKPPNELGLYDMTGNVFEWCADWWSVDYYEQSPRQDPSGPRTGEFKSTKGGSWFYAAGWIHLPSIRYQMPPFNGTEGVGIRVARDG